MEDQRFDVELRLEDGYRITADFRQEGVADLLMDEPAPLGASTGPNAARVLGAAIGNCLAASLLFCLQRARIDVQDLRASVSGVLARNEKGRLRIRDVRVTLHPAVAEQEIPRMQRCLGVFEDFCVVTQSVRDGLNVQVAVEVDPVPLVQA
jgi:organic hydroperoxide reductase OsmC/OhrA